MPYQQRHIDNFLVKPLHIMPWQPDSWPAIALVYIALLAVSLLATTAGLAVTRLATASPPRLPRFSAELPDTGMRRGATFAHEAPSPVIVKTILASLTPKPMRSRGH